MFLGAIADYDLSKLGKRVERLIKRIQRKNLLKYILDIPYCCRKTYRVQP